MKRYALVEVYDLAHEIIDVVTESRAAVLLKVAKVASAYYQHPQKREDAIGKALNELRAVWPDWDEE